MNDAYSRVTESDYLVTLGGISTGDAALVITDPPIGVAYANNFTHNPHAVIQGDSEEFSYAKLGHEIMRILRNDGAAIVYTGWSKYPVHFQELAAAGLRMREPYIIQKRPSGKTGLYVDSQSNGDWWMYGTKGKHRFRKTQLLRNKRAGTIPNPGRKPVPEWKTRFPSCWFGDDFPKSTANPVTQKQWRHPTPKDPEFIEWMILIHTDPGDLVVDPFCGSGPTAVAAKKTGRCFVGGDIVREYVAMTQVRVLAT